ncbi:putative ubiquitin-conjugating enzyme E2 24 [Heracleum sosnowskyi]|uniref:E2 ubiquitin-conjugating enzyme n=1 Tax=Heracleum sosnowskyi TaxID=360622 RepID=A0AAD8MJQ6_9APIA|nr:putative ubiquitin-conjugating enzyme E2 24 [Heracleum sosnowskyi]
MDSPFSDCDSYSYSSSSEDQEGSEVMYGGQASSILSSLEETMGKIDDFLSFERGFVHGDIVCSVDDPSGQMGKVINVKMIVDLENVYGTKTRHVDSNKLGKLRSISVGDYVVGGPWIGKVENIVDHITILFDDGTKCEYSTMGPEKLTPISPDLLDDPQYPYYPGQRVRVEVSSTAKSSRWLCGPREEKRNEGTVCAVDAGKVYVDWLACALVGSEKLAAPLRLQSSKNLTVLSCSSHSSWQLGDWCTLPLIDDMGFPEHLSLNSSKVGNVQSERVFESSYAPKLQDLYVIVKTMTKADVLWQDGSQSFGLDSQALFPINIIDAHDFWPDQYVQDSDDQHNTDNPRWGVVRSVDAKERTVRVRWETSTANQVSDPKAIAKEETVSAYQLVEHPDHSYCVGDAVFMLHKGHLSDIAGGKKYEDHETGKGFIDEAADRSTDLRQREDQSEYSSKSYLSRFGIIVDFNNGSVEVKWGTGSKTKVAPHDIFRVDKDEGLSVTSVLPNENVEELNETEQNDFSMEHEEKDLLKPNVDGNDCQRNSRDTSSLSFPSAIGFFTNVAANLFSSLGFNLLPHNQARSPMPNEIEALELCNLCTIDQPLEAIQLQTTAETHSEQKSEHFLLPSGSKSPKDFGQFEMVSDCLDHHFVDGSGKSLTSSQMKRGWLKKVQQEWSILEKDLPESIYVRVYEERMDLIRAAIIGAPGTPYHDNLFFFDIYLPPEYPHEPPLVHYNSGGLRVNPNLYESGKVCLSLLNTWTGSGSEVWNPGSSTILQVLLSLQALVLNEKPYFNEAGYDKQIGRTEGEKNSIGYNENAFLVSCKSMLYLLRRPPKHFEKLVKEHFARRCNHIVEACDAYMKGIPVGSSFGQKKFDEEIQKGSSTGFKIMLAKLLPKLVEAFSENGVDCSNYIQE